jgi:hypothetical protein
MTADHPSDRSGTAFLLVSLIAAPAAWITQLVVSYGLASFACQPTGAPQLRPAGFDWGGEHRLLIAVNLVCLAVTIASGVAPWRSRRLPPGPLATPAGEPKTAGHVRFLAVCGLMASAGFAIAVAFNTLEVFTVPACWRIG